MNKYDKMLLQDRGYQVKDYIYQTNPGRFITLYEKPYSDNLYGISQFVKIVLIDSDPEKFVFVTCLYDTILNEIRSTSLLFDDYTLELFLSSSKLELKKFLEKHKEGFSDLTISNDDLYYANKI